MRRLKRACCFAAVTICVIPPSIVARQQDLMPGEIVLGGYEQISPPDDVARFLNQTALAFVGQIESIRMVILPGGDIPPRLFTILTFKSLEVIKSKGTNGAGELIEVWRYGGTYIKTASGPQPVRPAGITRYLRPGALYFIAATIWDVPDMEGRYMLGGNTLVR